jgi:hypothetical protein
MSIGHGGILAGSFYMAAEDLDSLSGRAAASVAFSEFISRTVQVASAAAWQILARNGYSEDYTGADSIFEASRIEKLEDDVMMAFDRSFPGASESVWCTLLGFSSLGIELAERIGPRGYDPVRRRLTLTVDCYETGCLAIEMLWRGRLAGAGTVIRRLFELGLELQAWARFPGAMRERFERPASENRPAGREATPSATALIRILHGKTDSALQRRTYSTLCSIAHGGIQSQAYLCYRTSGGEERVVPAPVFAANHHRWLLGTLISSLHAALGGALLFAEEVDSDIAAGHWGYHQLVDATAEFVPGMTLVWPDEASGQPPNGETADEPTIP